MPSFVSPLTSCKLFADSALTARTSLFNSAAPRISSLANTKKMPSGAKKTDAVELICSDESLSTRLSGALKRPYVPYPGLRNRHAETIFAAFFRSRPRVVYRRELLSMSDNGTVALDWPTAGESEDLWKQQLSPDGPIVILLPGLTGGSQDSYVRHMVMRARRHGWRPVVFNSRGCADSPVTTPQFYSASFTRDLRQVVKHVSVSYPEADIYAIGWSLGANVLVRYLGEEGEDAPLCGAVSLCNPFNLVIADEDFHKGFNNVYDKSLAGGLRKIFKKHAHLFEGIGGEYNIPLVAKAKSVREFDEGLTRVSFGFKSVDDYYANSSSSLSIKYVKVPLLSIQADNDPIAPSRGIPRDDIKNNTNCLLVVTPYGGHLGWVAGEEAPFGAPWTDVLVIQYLEAIRSSSAKKSSKNIESVQEPGVASVHQKTTNKKGSTMESLY